MHSNWNSNYSEAKYKETANRRDGNSQTQINESKIIGSMQTKTNLRPISPINYKLLREKSNISKFTRLNALETLEMETFKNIREVKL